MSKEPLSKIYLILEKIEYIEEIIKNSQSITLALNDEVTTRPAILMHLTAIAEQFNNLKKENPKMLEFFDEADVKGMYDVRTYITHEYEGVNLAIVEWIVRNGLAKFQEQCQEIIKRFPKD